MVKIKLIFMVSYFLTCEKAFSIVSNVNLDSASVESRFLKVVDINRKLYTLRNKVCVFIFLDVECPISQYYTQNLQKLFVKYQMANIVFFTIFPTKYTHKAEIEFFNKKYELTIPSILDKFQNITKKLNATVTPEVFVLNKGGQIVDSGCIDNSFFALGKRNLTPKKLYLEQTLELLINNKVPQKSHVEAIGCEIQRIP